MQLAPMLVSTVLVATCAPKDGKIDCDTEIQYNARKVEGNVNVGKFGAAMNTEVNAVRQIDQVVERYMSRWMTLCKDYNGGAYSKEEYREETRDLRKQMEQIDMLLIKLDRAPDAASYQLALKEMYQTVVPDAERVELDVEFTVAAAAPGETEMRPVNAGSVLRTGSNIYVSVRPSRQAYIYLYQETGSGALNVLFPQAGIGISNPIGAGQEVRIPPAPATFVVTEEDVGQEHLYIVGSAERIPELEAALGSGGATVEQVNCAARALKLNAGRTCEQPRGLVLDPGTPARSQNVSLHATSSAGDDRILQVFTFQHER